jgi:hypothetical protein
MRKHPIRFFLFVLLVQILLVFSLNVMARSEDLSSFVQDTPYFSLTDIDQDSIPDHLAYTIHVEPDLASRHFWLCGELQAVIDGDWQTIAYTGRHFPGDDNTSAETSTVPSSTEATLHFYGGEIKRLKVDGPFRLLVKIKGVDLEEEQAIAFSPSYKHTEFEESDLVWVQGRKEKTSAVVEMVQRWATEQNLSLGVLAEATYNFDRWRLDYHGSPTEKAKRVWVEPGGKISWVNKG